MSTAQFKAGNTYRTRDGQKVTIDDISVAHPGYMIGRIGNDTALWSWHLNGRINNDGPNSPIDLMPNEIAQSIEDVTPDRLSVVESSLRDVHRQLRTLRGNQSEMIADMVAKLEQIVVRLDGTDRRVAAVNEGLKDAGDLLLKHEARLEPPNRVPAHRRIDDAYQRLAALEATLARIEDMLTSESNRKLADLGTGELVKGFVANHPEVIVTEEEAKTKRCQESFGDTIVTNNGHSFASSSPSPFQHGYSYPGGAQAFAVQTSPSMCIGSACMAWRWAIASAPYRDKGDIYSQGYCGKAGHP
jgi:hypothetical protein